MIALPETGYFGRMRGYLVEMHPLSQRLVMAGLTYMAIAAFAAHSLGLAFSPVSLHTALGIWSVFALMLMLRLMDELKDRNIDARLFPHRALPSGRVHVADIATTLAALVTLYVAANLWAGEALWAALFALAYAMLMFRHFFAMNLLRRSLPLTLATHNPIVPILAIYVLVHSVGEFGVSATQFEWSLVGPFVAMFWAAALAWELSRKIRAPADEDAYVTYSRLLGPVGAVAVAGGVQAISLGIAAHLYFTLALSPAYPAIMGLGFVIAAWGHGRFLHRPSTRTSNLKPYAEAFFVAVLCAQIIEFGGLV